MKAGAICSVVLYARGQVFFNVENCGPGVKIALKSMRASHHSDPDVTFDGNKSRQSFKIKQQYREN
jgi:hypothetical protein